MPSLGFRVLVSLLVFGSLNVSAQVTAGGLRGLVTDPNGATVADATVRATNVATGITSEATSTSAGVYVIGSLPVGQYHVEAQASGFKTSVTEDVQISTGTVSTLNIALQIGEIKQTVEVKETVTPLLQTTTSEVSTNVEAHVVMDLPLELSGDRRQVESFVFLTPGVTGSTFSKSFNGSPDLSQVAVVDGIAFSKSSCVTTNWMPGDSLLQQGQSSARMNSVGPSAVPFSRTGRFSLPRSTGFACVEGALTEA